jgi:hypothetical protein
MSAAGACLLVGASGPFSRVAGGRAAAAYALLPFDTSRSSMTRRARLIPREWERL